MRKKTLKIFLCIISLFIITGCGSSIKEKNNDTKKESNDVTNEIVVASTEYTELEIFGAKLKFKLANPTYLWNSEDDFGAGEVDTVFIPSENGEKVEDYFEAVNTSGVIFEVSDYTTRSETAIKKDLKEWYNLDAIVENINHNLYQKHIQGENSKLYYESYLFSYKGKYDGESIGDIDYKIQLQIYKNDYTKEEIDKVVKEFHIMIDTLEIINN